MRKGIEKSKEKIKSLRGKYKDLLDSSDSIEKEFDEESKYKEIVNCISCCKSLDEIPELLEKLLEISGIKEKIKCLYVNYSNLLEDKEYRKAHILKNLGCISENTGIEFKKSVLKFLEDEIYRSVRKIISLIEDYFNVGIEFRFAGYNVQISSVYRDKIKIPNL